MCLKFIITIPLKFLSLELFRAQIPWFSHCSAPWSVPSDWCSVNVSICTHASNSLENLSEKRWMDELDFNDKKAYLFMGDWGDVSG